MNLLPIPWPVRITVWAEASNPYGTRGWFDL